MTGLKPSVHAPDHRPVGWLGLTDPGGADSVANVSRALYEDSENVPVDTAQPMSWGLISGADLLDLSAPTEPVVRESGVYALTVTVHRPPVASSELAARYYRAVAAYSLPKNTIETADLTNHGLVYTNDTDGSDITFTAADYTGENYSFAAASPSKLTILTPGIYSVRYVVAINATYFTPAAFEVNLMIAGIDFNDSKVNYLDKTFDSVVSGDNAIYERVFNVLPGSCPLTIEFRAEQRSANDWTYTGGGTTANMAQTQIDLIKWEDSGAGLVASIGIDMDTGGDNVYFEQTFPLQAVELGNPAAIHEVYGTITAAYYIPAGHGVDAFIRHSSSATLNFDYQAVLQRLW